MTNQVARYPCRNRPVCDGMVLASSQTGYCGPCYRAAQARGEIVVKVHSPESIGPVFDRLVTRPTAKRTVRLKKATDTSIGRA